MDKQCLSIEQMRYLQELGVDTSSASMQWSYMQSKEHPEMKTEASLTIAIGDAPTESMNLIEVLVPAFTLQDIIELLPKAYIYGVYREEYELRIKYFQKDTFDNPMGKFMFMYENESHEYLCGFAKTDILEAAYELLCWCHNDKKLGKKYKNKSYHI